MEEPLYFMYIVGYVFRLFTVDIFTAVPIHGEYFLFAPRVLDLPEKLIMPQDWPRSQLPKQYLYNSCLLNKETYYIYKILNLDIRRSMS